jgi:sulfur carrier protein
VDLLINGQPRTFTDLSAGATLQDLLNALGLKPDRIAVEHNGSIVSRPAWPSTPIAEHDKFEIVHFVGGGAPPRPSLQRRNPLGTLSRCRIPVTRVLSESLRSSSNSPSA